MSTHLSHYLQTLHRITISRALISVSDKTGIAELASALHSQEIEIISTGGTAAFLRKQEIPVTDVSDITGFPECLDGRVKTLHPMIHGALLARPLKPEHAQSILALGIRPVELLVVNLYPFQKAVSEHPHDVENAMENLDIGGPAMLRAASKNFENLCVLTHPDQYAPFIEELETKKGISPKTRFFFSREAFSLTSDYDRHITAWFDQQTSGPGKDVPGLSLTGSSDPSIESAGQSLTGSSDPPAESPGLSLTGSSDPPAESPGLSLTGSSDPSAGHLRIEAPLFQSLRYGENPHQKAAVFGDPSRFIDCFHGKELSYNNYLDIDAALQLAADFAEEKHQTLCAIFKHSIPCGAALGDDGADAWIKAFSTDTVSPFGGIVLFNQTINQAAALEVDKIFSEIILAPGFDDDALELLRKKSQRRLIRVKEWPALPSQQLRSVCGGYLVQEQDSGFSREKFSVVTEKKPGEAELGSLKFAWKVVKHIKSNAILYAHHNRTLGVGTGQPNRVDSSRIAALKAQQFGHDLAGAVMASDAFFPFADSIEEASKTGISAIIQPGGSIRDQEVIQKADECGISMIFTGVRHFRH